MKLANIMNEMYLTDIYRILHPNTKRYTFFSAPQETFTKTDHIVRHKANLNRNKKIETTDLQQKTETKESLVGNSWKLNNSLYNDH
jgi:exonuclease III